MSKTVYMPSPASTLGLDRTFGIRGWKVLRDNTIKDTIPDLICFTGGEDINPSIYGEKPARQVRYWSTKRDQIEMDVFHRFIGVVPMAGVCRGGQLINCLKGGKLYQHVNNHEHGTHPIIDCKGREVMVSSVHHQMMIPPDDEGVIYAWAKLSTIKVANDEDTLHLDKASMDPEVIIFHKEKLLCVQFHPEFGPDSCTNYFFNLMDKYILEPKNA